ncbi:RNA polymerase sigma factor SigJ [Kitasatospora aureofaciens]|uniref:DNA-directed RNA polymerase sigma-70 factor n=1 Tax=Kitasatospora aureofaciens TaxID=1894 RepID=A0A1E7N148_KITAU|nr:RNA polymerase sigma factor SigJ [Kitasatospora aureofaciens]ARF79236.1 RNA polymerase subunit sigma-70 [Kitasatospora aureofaciens]OEV34418.1 RNA polymerase subunit sigma-70 [Kitasatospora aureofaciens]GGU67851.1 DNA-directed RNA polymerase sigma-70 factor [Kitasatospora aureofaciens]
MSGDISRAELLAAQFEAERPQLRSLAYRMLGSVAEAEDAVQEAWLKLSRSDVGEVRNLGAWLTTVVGRVCLDQLRSRASRREDPLPEQEEQVRLPDPVVTGPAVLDPVHEILVADSVGIALMVVLETLSPAERVAFVLHDMFDVPFDGIAEVLGRTPASTRQLASRARRRVQGATPAADSDDDRKRAVVEAFLSASRGGDFDALLAVLDPEVLARSDGGTLVPSVLRRGAADVAGQAITFARFAAEARLVLVNGSPGVVSFADGRVLSVMSFTIHEDRITGLDILTDPTRLAALGLTA